MTTSPEPRGDDHRIYFLLAAVPHAHCLKPASMTSSSMKLIRHDLRRQPSALAYTGHYR